jgi:hypothetical protein
VGHRYHGISIMRSYLGFGALAILAGQNAMVSSVAISEIGKASGALNKLRQLDGAFGVTILVAPP